MAILKELDPKDSLKVANYVLYLARQNKSANETLQPLIFEAIGIYANTLGEGNPVTLRLYEEFLM
jgi:hypothetical protein